MKPLSPNDPVGPAVAALLELTSEYAGDAPETHERPRVAAAIAACLDRLAADGTAVAWLPSLAADRGDRRQPVSGHCHAHARAAARQSILALVRVSLAQGGADNAR